MKKHILIGISGGIAACKTPELIRTLVSDGYDVRAVLTRTAAHFVTPEELTQAGALSVYSDLFEQTISVREILRERHVEHIEVADNSLLFVIVPATANVIAKLAHGIADDYLTTVALAAPCPVLVCPSMNVHMWNHPATVRNMRTLHSLGYHQFGPDEGQLACGYTGKGRLPDIASIYDEIRTLAGTTQSLAGRKVIVTAGSSSEPIDDVRSIVNKSSGKMGIAIADACVRRGADVLLLHSASSVTPRYAMKELVFDTADSLQALLKSHAAGYDICFHTAAVSDFSVVAPVHGKIPSSGPLPLELTPRSKIVDSIKSYNPKIYLVAFKAEHGVSDTHLVSLASERLKTAGADCIIANDVGRPGIGFQSDDNEVWIIHADGKTIHIPKQSKHDIAEAIVTDSAEQIR